MPAWIPEAWNQLNEDNQKQLSNFPQFLLSQQDAHRIDAAAAPRKLGLLADRFEFMSDDFNAPLDEFKEYL